jgi:hypothetical protein
VHCSYSVGRMQVTASHLLYLCILSLAAWQYSALVFIVTLSVMSFETTITDRSWRAVLDGRLDLIVCGLLTAGQAGMATI